MFDLFRKISVGLIMGTAAFAEEGRLTLPQTTQDPVSLHALGAFQVFVGPAEACCAGRTPMAGQYTQNDGGLSFTPAFGFNAGQTYVVRHEGILTPFLIDHGQTPAEVTAIFPAGDSLPENTLRFYIQFSTPMQPHMAFDYIHLRDASGAVDPAAFMQFKQELWSADRTRLTVLIDPGRIKRGVATNLDLGPALTTGARYSLTVDPGWPAADGQSVLGGMSKSFTVSPPLRTRPDMDLWTITAPPRATQEPLRITFDRAFDNVLLQKDLWVATQDGTPLMGAASVAPDGTAWSFTPDAP